MPKTTKKTTTTKMTKTIKTARAPRTVKTTKAVKQVSEPGFNLLNQVQHPIELVKDVATNSIRLGLGLGAYLLDRPQDIKLGALRGNLRQNLNSLVTNAINKGEKIEQAQLTWLSNFEREQRTRVKEFLAARKHDIERTEASLEERIEEVIASLDIPTRNDIHQLNRRLNDLSKELARQRTSTARAAKNSTKKTPKQTEVIVEATTTNA